MAQPEGEAPPRVVIQTYPAPYRRTFHVNRELKDFDLIDNKSLNAESLRTAIGSIKGVKGLISVDKDSVTVAIGLAYQWDVIEPQILDKIAAYLNWWGVSIEKSYVMKRKSGSLKTEPQESFVFESHGPSEEEILELMTPNPE